jgi:hypothetical protein
MDTLLTERGIPKPAKRETAKLPRLVHCSFFTKSNKMSSKEEKPAPALEPNWRSSSAKRHLKSYVENGKDIDANGRQKSGESIYLLRPEYKQYKLKNFKKKLETLRNTHNNEISAAALAEKATNNFLKQHPPSATSSHGYPRYHGSTARAYLKADIDAKKHLKMKPEKLRSTKEVYQQFPKKVFRDHIYQETKARKQRYYNSLLAAKPAEEVQSDDSSTSE